MKKPCPGFGLILVVCFSLIGGGCAMSRIEEPKFELLHESGDIQIRKYQPTIVAETVVSGSFYDAPNEGFRRLAGYIFGKNKSKNKIAMTAPVSTKEAASSEKIAMTAPVSQLPADEAKTPDQWLITFTMPSSYTLQSLPEPLDARVTLREVPGYEAAVLRFSGFNNDETVRKNTELLMTFISQRGLRPLGPSVYARYNPPWTPWFMRRHEIIIPVGPK